MKTPGEHLTEYWAEQKEIAEKQAKALSTKMQERLDKLKAIYSKTITDDKQNTSK